MYICNAFSLQMLPSNRTVDIRVEHISLDEVRGLEMMSAIGHADTAVVVSAMLGKELPASRVNVKLEAGDCVIVAQVMGGRLPEGSTTLPEGIQLTFMKVTVSVAF